MATNSDISKSKSNKGSSAEDIVKGFNELRQQQRAMATKISELEQELKEHDLVTDTLKEANADRKCFRLVGGVLVERTVGEVLPALLNNKDQLSKLVEVLSKQIQVKGEEINAYREKHNIRVRGEEDISQEESKQTKPAGSQGVLVAKET